MLLRDAVSANQLQLYGDFSSHDPSRMVKYGDTYYVFMTGGNVPFKKSTDMQNWSFGGVVFPNGPPPWTVNEVPGFGGNFWAPDIVKVNGIYYLYYSCSSFGSQNSAIGVATATHPGGPWTDQGRVIQSYTGDVYNCIDAAPFLDSNGTLWMTFGSYWGGIFMVQLDPATGRRIAPNSPITHVAGGDTEAAYLHKQGNWYYLFINRNACCSGIDSTYNIRIGRSLNVTGPFLDLTGVDMRDSNTNTRVAESSGRYYGPGHAGILEENGRYWFSYHYYDGLYNGAPTLGIRELKWTGDGWPDVTIDWSTRYTFDIDAREQTGQYPGALADGASIINDAERGRVLSLAGGTQHVGLPVSIVNGRTYSAWVKWNGGPAWQRIFDFGAGTNAYMYLTPAAASGRMRFGIYLNGANQGVEAPMAMPVNQWCHVAVTLDASVATLYLNGEAVAKDLVDVRTYYLLAKNLYLGRSQFSADPHFSGLIDDFRVHSKALTGGEIAQLLGKKVGGASAVAYWNFEEGAADAYVPYAPANAGAYDGSIRDVTGNANHLSAWTQNWERYRIATPSAITPATGLSNTMSVQNANIFPALSAVGTSLTRWTPTFWTIEAAIRPDGTSGFQTIVGRDSYGANAGNPALAGLYFAVRPGGVLAIQFIDAAGGNWNLASPANAIVAQKWHTVAATSDGRTLRLYRRNLTDNEATYTLLGSLDISSSTFPALHPGSGDGPDWDAGVITVGRGLYNGGHTDRFLGFIDDVRLSEAALSPTEFLYRPSTTAAHWNFEEGTANASVSYSPASAGAYDGRILDVAGSANHLSAWDKNLEWYRPQVALPVTPRTGVPNLLSVQNANAVPGMSAIGTSLTNWNPGEWTIEASIRPDAVAGYQTIVGRDSFGAHDSNKALAALYFSVRPNGILAISFTDAAGCNWSLESAANAIVAGQWQAVAATSNGSTLRLYRRNITAGGVYNLLGSLDISGSPNHALSRGAGDGANWDAGVITVGRGLFNGGHTDRFLGYLDDIRISSAALTPKELLYDPPTTEVANGTYYLTPRHATDKALSVLDAAPNNGAALGIKTYTGATSQKFLVDLQNDGTYRLRTAMPGNRAVELPLGVTTNGTKVKLLDENGAAAQRWCLISLGGGKFDIAPKGNIEKTLDVDGASTANGALAQSWDYLAGLNQQWTLTPAVVVPVPANLTAMPEGARDLRLNWSAVAGATGYNVSRSTTTGGPYAIVGSNVSGTTYLNGGLTAGTTYYYVVTALSSAGESNPSAQASGVPLTAAEFWRETHFGITSNTGDASDLADPNGDGEVNLMEFATSQNPNAGTLAGTALARNGANIEFTYTRSLAALSDGAAFNVQWSDSLGEAGWSPVGVTEEILSNNGTVQTVQATVEAGSLSRFLRLRVSK